MDDRTSTLQSSPGSTAAHPAFSRTRLAVLLFLLLALLPAACPAAELAARVDRDRIHFGESIQLTLEAEGNINSDPDLAPLQQDFDVLGSSRGSSINMINGRVTSRSTWTIPLMPKRSGELTIPALTVDGQHSRPIPITVSEAAATAESWAEVFLESEVRPESPFIQQQVLAIVRLFYTDKLREGSLSAPEPPNTVVRQLGKDRNGTVNHKGRQYQVLERRYALFPQASGRLEIPAPVFDGVIAVPSGRRSPFGSMFDFDPFDSATRQVRTRGKAQGIEVRPRPAEAEGSHWLPAKSLEAEQEWSTAEGIRVGDPLTRTITLVADGLTAAQLPDLAPEGLADFNVYPDKAREDTVDKDDGVIGTRTLKIAFLPTRAGTLTLPDLRLHWWNVATNRQETLELPGKSISVLPPAGLEAQAAPAPVASPEPEASVDTTASSTTPAALPLPAEAPASPLYQWLALAFAGLWLLTLGFYVYERKKRGKKKESPAHPEGESPRAREAQSRFRESCKQNDPKAARQALLAWAAAHWPTEPPRGLEELGRRLDDDRQVMLLRQLDECLYRGNASWNGEEPLRCIEQLPSRKSLSRPGKNFTDLYSSH